MRSGLTWTLLLATVLTGGASSLAAQSTAGGRPSATPAADTIPARGDTAAQVVEPARAPVQPGIRPIRVAKWMTLAGTIAAAVYGYHQNRLADSHYEDLDRICQSAPDRCQARTSTGAYQDADLEARYEEVKRLDHQAAVGLVGAEVGVATTVALFLLDLRHAAGNPPNIPYNPPRLQVVPRRGGGLEVGAHINVGSGRD